MACDVVERAYAITDPTKVSGATLMHPGHHITKVYLACRPVDFRKSIDGLSAEVEQSLGLNVFEPSVFVFVNRGRTKIKALYWHRNGFCLWYKRLEADKFAWPMQEFKDVRGTAARGTNVGAIIDQTDSSVSIDMQQLEWLLEGFDLWRNKPHKTLDFAVTS
jgi:transposase